MTSQKSTMNSWTESLTCLKKKFRLANKNKLVGKTKNARQWRWGAVEIKTLEEAQLSVITRSGI